MARHTPPRVVIYRRHAADDTEPSSLATQEAALRAYLADHPDWAVIPVFDNDRSQPFDRPRATRRPLPAQPQDDATTDRSAIAHRRQ